MGNERSRNNYRLVFLFCLLSISTVFPGKRGWTQDFENNPLLTVDKSDYPLGTLRDRLIPAGYGTRELTSFEKYRIEETISELGRSAEAQLKQGNDDEAFKLWYRRLMLTRALDRIQEIEGLGEIGAIAWKENRGTDVRNIAERLIAIEEELGTQISFDALNKLATAYEQVRYLDRATGIYQQIVVNGRKQNNPTTQQKNLETLGELYLARFKYSQAADVYQELLTFTKANESKQTVYLQNLADIYDRISQPEKAIAVNKRLIALADTQTSKRDLEIAIARDYEALNQTNEAVEAYDRALLMALADRELATASDILSRLGEIYRDEQIDKAMPSAGIAIATYNKLLEVQQQSYDDYGMLDTYDTLGKIYLDSDKTKAKQYFQQGLELATSLNHRVKYFSELVNQTSNK